MGKNIKNLLAWIMMLMMMVNLIPFQMVVYAEEEETGTDVTDDLTDLVAVVSQGGAQIEENGTLTSTEPISIVISFGVPVEGDVPTPANPVQKGDFADFELSNAFTLLSGANIELKTGDNIVVGHVEITRDSTTGMVAARVDFDGENEVFDGTYHSVKCYFSAELEFDPIGGVSPGEDCEVTILEKTYTVTVPPLETEYTVAKSGEADLAAQCIAWTVVISAKQGDEHVDLAGYKFYDDLTAVGTYIEDTFQIKDDGEFKQPADDDFEVVENMISYTFPEGSTSPQTIVFRTEISDAAYLATTQQNVKNTAQLLDEEENLLVENDYTVKFTPEWIKKTGKIEGEYTGGVYNPKDRTITWTIEANHMGATLDDVVITDVLPGGLIWKSASVEKYDGSSWDDKPTWTEQPVEGKYELGDVNFKIKLTIVASVPDEAYTAGITNYYNSASIRWDGLPALGPGTGNVGVPVGYVPIAKTGSIANKAKGIIKWTVTVDPRGQNISGLKVYDLLVYGSSLPNWADVTFPTEMSEELRNIIKASSDSPSSALHPRYNQKYKEDTFAKSDGSNLELACYQVTQDGRAVADLLEVTGLSPDDRNSFTFESLITNPDIFAGNKTKPVQNTASLFSGGKWLNKADATVNFASKTLAKEMLKRGYLDDPAQGVNKYTTNAAEGFDYQDKSVIFRLSINYDGLDLTNMENAAGEKLGKAIVTDTLPAGWEFVAIDSGKMFLIFEGEAGSGSVVRAKGTSPVPVDVTGLSSDFNETGKATFTFETLDQPYVILVKARPTAATAAGYFSENGIATVANGVYLKTEKWTSGVSVTRNVTVESKLLDKNYTIPEIGVLKWTVDYRPYDLFQQGTKLKDKIPEGLELRTDSAGALLVEGNITAHEMTLNNDGSYTQGEEVTLVTGSNLFYDNEGRFLSFTIPDPSRGYSFSYITDITGIPGEITNRVVLCDEGSEQEESRKSYSITAADGGASLGRNGWMEIEKRDGSTNALLPGVEFTLFATDGITVIRKGVTGADGTLRFKVIPDGEYIFRETAAPEGYGLEGVDHTLTVVTIDDVPTASIDGKGGADAHKITLRNYPEGTVGSLAVRKMVDGNAADSTKKFGFTVTFDLPAGTSEGTYDTYTYNSENALLGMGAIINGGTISLAHGERIIITGLPKDTVYTVTEEDCRGESYVTVSEDENGTIIADETVSAAFTNTRNVGSLTITKNVAGNGGDYEKEFEFTVEFTPPEGMPDSYPFSGEGVFLGVTIASGDTIFLAHGQSITIEDLPEGTVYTVTEKDYTGDAYVSSGLIASGVIATAVESVAGFTNTRNVGSLTITKTVAGNGGDLEKEFEFTVELTPPEGMPTTYSYTGEGVPDGTITSGDKITLSHGQRVTIEELPVGTVYTVMEADYTSDYYVTGSVGAGGTIATGETVAAFTNTRKVSTLMIKKTVGGALGDQDRDFTFVVNLEAGGSYRYWGSKTGTIESGQAITLKHDEYIVIEGIPVDTGYRVTEVEANRDGYRTTSTGAEGKITTAGKTAAFVNIKGDLTNTGAGGLNTIWGMLLIVSLSMFLTVTGLILTSRNKRSRRSH